jgi:hypothetical protein
MPEEEDMPRELWRLPVCSGYHEVSMAPHLFVLTQRPGGGTGRSVRGTAPTAARRRKKPVRRSSGRPGHGTRGASRECGVAVEGLRYQNLSMERSPGQTRRPSALSV